MKAIITASILLLATVAGATGVHYEWPTVNGLSVNTLCATEDKFKTVTPVTYCAETKVVARWAVRPGGEAEIRRPLRDGDKLYPGEYLEEETACARYASENREVSRFITVTKCIRSTPSNEASIGECLEWASHTEKAGLNYTVTKVADYGEADQITFEPFTIPMCRE